MLLHGDASVSLRYYTRQATRSPVRAVLQDGSGLRPPRRVSRNCHIPRFWCPPKHLSSLPFHLLFGIRVLLLDARKRRRMFALCPSVSKSSTLKFEWW
ncbi:hypothetical protein BDP55DRAFT_664283 [Colletotrichum godetiae]|uniref:Uncharacterized protein n=1 Tax=Colletotrichum godetiae TaxID=1209918 RepID=A0AAJ0AKC3_9PEZI|nr:uncharacterized protein BDP55DRAFT_664283 [Colletotrichum godetiae]KAK1675462.1 hypothetical protein BDP55DRAFT_664283 [Colletotrichum godetiae]